MTFSLYIIFSFLSSKQVGRRHILVLFRSSTAELMVECDRY